MDRLRVLSLNIWNRQGPWEQRLPLIRRGIEELRPDVIGLQEVLHLDGTTDDQATAIADGFGYHIAYASAWEIGGGLHLGNAILARFPIAAQREWHLPNDPDEETRGLLYAELDTPTGKWPVFVTHLAWKFEQGPLRLRQVEFIVDRIAELGRTAAPPILMGDFNAEPDSDEIRYLRGLHHRGPRGVYLTDLFGAYGDGAPGHTFDRRNPFALQTREPSRRIDYIFTGLPDRQGRGEPINARVVLDHAESEVFPSDHFGVYAELRTA